MADHVEDRAAASRDAVPRWRRGASAEEVHRALRNVPFVSRRYRGRGVPFDELVAAGNLGLVQAAVRFEPQRDVKFTSYADWWIRKAILEALKEQTGPLRIPRHQFEKIRRLRAAQEDWLRCHHERPDEEQLALASGLSPREVRRLTLLLCGSMSLDQPPSATADKPLKELLPDRDAEGPARTLMRRDLADRVRRHLRRLSRSQRRVLELRFGLVDGEALSLRQVGSCLGLSRERVRQIELRALLRLRELL